ncbi:MAG: type I restriction enzyme HsdR N-terminal domain-containing protein [Candidatus Tectomicrobia bacterium]|nr:type I restriction enzyme HsdR N-terminal domain-containing protein [Candidatus Tectomicrobia bacterium]
MESRLADGLKKYQPIIRSARDRDINESDTSVIVADVLAELFGYDKYSEITTEYAIRGTYCDLAIKIDGKPHLLIEVKAAAVDFKESHVKQAVDYASNQGVDWVALTNGVIWKVFRVIFAKPIHAELLVEIDLLSLNPRNSSHLESLYLLTREGVLKSALLNYHTQKQALDRFSLAAILTSDLMLNVIRRELRRLSPGISIQIPEIRSVLEQDVLKREVVEGDYANEAKKRIQRVSRRLKKLDQPKTGDKGMHEDIDEPPTIRSTLLKNDSASKVTGESVENQAKDENQVS